IKLMKQSMMKIQLLTMAIIMAFLISSCSEKGMEVPEEHISEIELSTTDLKSGLYEGNLKYVIADVQHGFLDRIIDSHQEVDNLVAGLLEMKVNGVRLPIFAETAKDRYNEFYDAFYTKARQNNLKVFATPVLHGGGKRIANGWQFFYEGDGPVINNNAKTQKLIDEIKAYSQMYSCDWISPFCEDGAPGNVWSKNQINQIFSSLNGELNGAKLIGPCTWGIVNGTALLENTNVLEHISIATTHNLGNQDYAWADFKSAAGNLEVWDSETNLDPGNTVVPRIKAAIDAGVDGIVLYYVPDAGVDLSTGALKDPAKNMMNYYLKGYNEGPGPNIYYFLVNKNTGKRLRPYNYDQDALIVQAPITRSGHMVQWKYIDEGDGYFTLRNRQTGKYFQPANSNNWANIIQKNNPSSWTQWTMVDKGNGYFLLKNRETSKWIRSRTHDDLDSSTDMNRIKVEQSRIGWENAMEQYKFERVR
ncbi:MAG: RICIN domain-containing protein, partial [Bacteroidales bacterium]|nr:RICIN domain-containing protein [Bacteroidales bacterium]